MLSNLENIVKTIMIQILGWFGYIKRMWKPKIVKAGGRSKS